MNIRLMPDAPVFPRRSSPAHGMEKADACTPSFRAKREISCGNVPGEAVGFLPSVEMTGRRDTGKS